MSIKFICICGKRLRAREEMAARRSVCPRCGRPVGIPSLKPTHRGGEARPLTPAERFARRRSGLPVEDLDTLSPAAPIHREDPPPPRSKRVAAEPVAPDSPSPVQPPRPLDPSIVRQALPRRQRAKTASAVRPWQPESRWYEYFIFPLRAGLYIAGLSIILTIVTGVLTLLLPEFLQVRGKMLEHGVWIVPSLALLALVAGYAFTLLDGALMTGCAGKPAAICWPGRNLRIAYQASARWLFCLLPGPVVGVYAGFRYWLNCGEPEMLDWLILAEIGSLSLGYWLLLLVAVAQGGRLLDAHPGRVVLLLAQLGPAAVPVVTIAGLALLAHAALIFYALSSLHGHGDRWLMLLGAYVSVLFWGVLLCRWLGLWCHRRTA